MYEISEQLEILGNEVIGKFDEFNSISENNIKIIYPKTDKPKHKNGGTVAH